MESCYLKKANPKKDDHNNNSFSYIRNIHMMLGENEPGEKGSIGEGLFWRLDPNTFFRSIPFSSSCYLSEDAGFLLCASV